MYVLETQKKACFPDENLNGFIEKVYKDNRKKICLLERLNIGSRAGYSDSGNTLNQFL